MDYYDCYVEEADFGRCRKHPSQPRHGVCASCLRDRLSLLCTVCARVRPCTCEYPPSSDFFCPPAAAAAAAAADVASSSTSSSLSTAELGVGSVAPMSLLLSSEPSFRRSRSTALTFLRSKPPVAERPRRPPLEEAKPRLSTSSSSSSSSSSYFWLFWRSSEKAKRRSEREESKSKVDRLSRSRSVGVSCRPDAAAEVSSGGMKGWGWHFPSPIKAFRLTKAEKLVQQRSPLCRG